MGKVSLYDYDEDTEELDQKENLINEQEYDDEEDDNLNDDFEEDGVYEQQEYEVCEECDGSGVIGRDDDICHSCNGSGIRR
jgi:hypothetical protein